MFILAACLKALFTTLRRVIILWGFRRRVRRSSCYEGRHVGINENLLHELHVNGEIYGTGPAEFVDKVTCRGAGGITTQASSGQPYAGIYQGMSAFQITAEILHLVCLTRPRWSYNH